MNPTHYRLPDTRAYPTDPVKNELLLHAAQLAAPTSKAQATLARETLAVEIAQMLAQNHYLNLSVALALAPNAAVYSALWQSLADVLAAHGDDEVQWLALPVVVVAVPNKRSIYPTMCQWLRSKPFFKGSLGYPIGPPYTGHLICSVQLNWGQLKRINGLRRKKNAAAAESLLSTLSDQGFALEAGQSVQVRYAVGFAGKGIQAALSTPLGSVALPLMQAWQTHFHTPGATLFTNPMMPMTPMTAMREGNALRLRMACDVFTTNAVRAIRLQSPRVGVVIAAQAGGRLLFGFNATDAVFELAPQVFAWPLTPADNMDTVVQQFIDLLAECQVENIRLLHEPLAEADALPNYAQAIHMLGHNPLFTEHH